MKFRVWLSLVVVFLTLPLPRAQADTLEVTPELEVQLVTFGGRWKYACLSQEGIVGQLFRRKSVLKMRIVEVSQLFARLERQIKRLRKTSERASLARLKQLQEQFRELRAASSACHYAASSPTVPVSEGSSSSSSNSQGSSQGDSLSSSSSDLSSGSVAPEPLYLIPGQGFSGPAAVPSSVGGSALVGYDAKVIARWDVVPHQSFSDTINIGVVAFHMNGVDRVELSVNGGEWMKINRMTLNPESGVTEYWATLRAKDLPDGAVEVRAIAYPKTAGVPRVLQGKTLADNGENSLFLYASHGNPEPSQILWVSPSGNDSTGDGTQVNPYQTIHRALSKAKTSRSTLDRAVIYLTAGSHAWIGGPGPINATTGDSYLVIAGAPGTTRDQVMLMSGGTRLNANLVKFQGLTITQSLPNGWPTIVWLDNVVMRGERKFDYVSFGGTGWSGGLFVTNSRYHTLANAARGYNLVRGVTIDGISSDAFSSSKVVLNSSVDGISVSGWQEAGLSESPHPDIYNHVDGMENLILYDVVATNAASLGVSLGGAGSNKDVAMVNLLIETQAASANQIGCPVDHLVMENLTYNGGLLWRYQQGNTKFRAILDGVSIRNLSIRNSVFDAMSINSWSENAGSIRINNNHFGTPISWFAAAPSWATLSTFGDPKFINPLVHDYRPDDGSPLRGRMMESFVPNDLVGKEIMPGGSIGVFQPPS